MFGRPRFRQGAHFTSIYGGASATASCIVIVEKFPKKRCQARSGASGLTPFFRGIPPCHLRKTRLPWRRGRLQTRASWAVDHSTAHDALVCLIHSQRGYAAAVTAGRVFLVCFSTKARACSRPVFSSGVPWLASRWS